MEGRVRRWKLVEDNDGEFTSADILYIWVLLHLYPGGGSSDSHCTTTEKMLPKMKKIYDSF